MSRLIALLLVFGYASAMPAADTTEKSCGCVCGVRGRTNRIVGGSETSANEYPWVVGLYRYNKQYCGGALISDKHVLTAAHCVHSFDRREIKVYLGGHNISTDYVDVRRINRIYEHEYFDTSSFDFDIALLELNKAVQFGPKIQPACLPQSMFEDYSGKIAMIAGWGRLVIVLIWSKDECNESDYGKKRLTNNMMCAGYQKGDSGGPMHYEGDTRSMEIIGVVSWGRVANFLPWIESKVSKQCMCSPKNGVRTGFLETIAESQKEENDIETKSF